MTVTLITHVLDEAVLLPHFVRHYASMVDRAIVLDYGSTDGSADIVREMAPSWKVVRSRNGDFEAEACDAEVMDYECDIDGWKLAMNATEFLHAPGGDLRGYLAAFERARPYAMAVAVRPVTVVDRFEEITTPMTDAPLWQQRWHGYVDANRGRRFVHRAETGRYGVGRHSTALSYAEDPSLLILWYGAHAFMPLLRARKQRMAKMVPASDLAANRGRQHVMDDAALTKAHATAARVAYDLRTLPMWRECVTAPSP